MLALVHPHSGSRASEGMLNANNKPGAGLKPLSQLSNDKPALRKLRPQAVKYLSIFSVLSNSFTFSHVIIFLNFAYVLSKSPLVEHFRVTFEVVMKLFFCVITFRYCAQYFGGKASKQKRLPDLYLTCKLIVRLQEMKAALT